MMPRIMQADPTLAGVIVMAGSVRPLEEIIVEQFEYLSGLEHEMTAAQQARLAAIRRDPWMVLPGATGKYKADLKDYNPVALAAASPVPMLILQGERDLPGAHEGLRSLEGGACPEEERDVAQLSEAQPPVRGGRGAEHSGGI